MTITIPTYPDQLLDLAVNAEKKAAQLMHDGSEIAAEIVITHAYEILDLAVKFASQTETMGETKE